MISIFQNASHVFAHLMVKITLWDRLVLVCVFIDGAWRDWVTFRPSKWNGLKPTNPQSSVSSVQLSHSVVSYSLRPHELQHARPPCPSPTPGVHPDTCPSSQWCHPAISSSVVPLSSCPQSLQHQSLFQWVNSSHEVAKVLEFQL